MSRKSSYTFKFIRRYRSKWMNDINVAPLIKTFSRPSYESKNIPSKGPRNITESSTMEISRFEFSKLRCQCSWISSLPQKIWSNQDIHTHTLILPISRSEGVDIYNTWEDNLGIKNWFGLLQLWWDSEAKNWKRIFEELRPLLEISLQLLMSLQTEDLYHNVPHWPLKFKL